MNIRVAGKSDVNDIRKMWENSRGGGVFTQWFFDKIFYSANAVLAETDEDTVACACTIPYKMSVNNNEIDVSYIGAIIANPETRTPDILNPLMADTLSFIDDKNMPIAFVVPDNYKFFERYGFALCYDYKQYDITPGDLPAYGVNGTILRPDSFNKEIIETLNTIYKKFNRNKNGYAIRDEEGWKLILDDLYKNFNGKCVIYKNLRNEVVGYMLYIIRDSKMWVYELAYSRREGFEGLVGFIKAHEGMINKISLKMPSDDLLYMNFCDNRGAVTQCPFAMARIIDVKKALNLFVKNAPENVRLQVVDRVVEENNHTFAFDENGAITVDDTANVATDIGTLTQLLLGYISVDDAFRLNLITGDASLLKNLFEKKTTYINMLYV